MTLLVTNLGNPSVLEYNETTGAFVRAAVSGVSAASVVIGLDGNLLVADGQNNQVKRYDRKTGAFIDVLASTNLVGPEAMTIHQSILYVTNTTPPGVQRFNATTGVNTGHFVPSLPHPYSRDVKVNPANNRLYVLYYSYSTVEMFDLSTMASRGLLMPVGNPIGSGGLYTPMRMAFGPDGNLYITGGTFPGNVGVRRYNPTTGAFIDFFANTGDDYAFGIAFGPDNNLYVGTVSSITGAAAVTRFNYPTGASMGFFVPSGSGGLTEPFGLTFAPDLTYTLHRDCLNDIVDSGMSWQIEGGRVLEDGTHIADYSSVKRVSCGTTHQNTAQLWVTLFYIGKKPPENVTLHGAHDFHSGGEIGSVSAASSAFSAHIGKQFKRVGNTLTIG
jgi:hypothetical protein